MPGWDSREVTGSFLVLALLFREESGEGDDVCVNLLRARASGMAIGTAIGGHLGLLLVR